MFPEWNADFRRIVCVCYEYSNGHCVWSILYAYAGLWDILVTSIYRHSHWENRGWCLRSAGYRAGYNCSLENPPHRRVKNIVTWSQQPSASMRGCLIAYTVSSSTLHFREFSSYQRMPYLAAGILQLWDGDLERWMPSDAEAFVADSCHC